MTVQTVEPALRSWTTRRDEKRRRMRLVQPWMKGPVLPGAKIIDALEALIVSGEGGFVTTDDEWLYTRAQSWHDTAACWRPDRFAHERREGELFAGENYRKSELEGAVVANIKRKGAMAEEMAAELTEATREALS